MRRQQLAATAATPAPLINGHATEAGITTLHCSKCTGDKAARIWPSLHALAAHQRMMHGRTAKQRHDMAVLAAQARLANRTKTITVSAVRNRKVQPESQITTVPFRSAATLDDMAGLLLMKRRFIDEMLGDIAHLRGGRQ